MLDALVMPVDIKLNDYYHGLTVDVEFRGFYDESYDIVIEDMSIRFNLLHPSQEKLQQLHHMMVSGKKIAILIGEPPPPPPDSEEKT